MHLVKLLCSISLTMFLVSCAAPAPRVLTTMSPDVKRLPTTIALHPLLTSHLVNASQFRTLSAVQEGREIYLAPPTSSKLEVTLPSQMMTDLLSGELAYRGFSLKELPFEALAANDDRKASGDRFAISLDLLQKLRAEYGLEAVLIGNVYFIRDPYSRDDLLVKAVHCKLIDVETLDVLCHVAIPPAEYSMGMVKAVTVIASEMARLAQLETE